MKRLIAAKSRLQSILSRKDKWKENKEYILSYHNSQSIKPYILLNPDVFKSFKKGEIIVISFQRKEEGHDIQLIFKLSEENFAEQTKKNISLNKKIVDLIEKKYNFKPVKSKVLVRKTNKENFALKEIVIELKEYIPRSELFSLTLNMLNDCAIIGQEIYNKDKKLVGSVTKLSNDALTGVVTFWTNFKITSLTSDIYLMFDISKSSYNYNSYFNLNYEVIIDYVKNLLLKLKSQTTYHNIHIYFYIRIFFKSTNNYKEYKFIRKEPFEENKYYFDIYDRIDAFNAEHIDIKEIVYKMNKIYQNYENIQNEKYQKAYFKNLNQFLFSIRNNLQFPLDEEGKDFLNSYYDILSYTFEGYENCREGEKSKECSELDNSIFEDVTEFEISSFNTIGIFEALMFAISQIENNKKNKIKKYTPLINIVLSGESFPYYCEDLADKVRSSIYEEYINLYFTYLCPKNKVSIFSRKKTSNIKEDYEKNIYKKIVNNDEYYKLDNFLCEIPTWCKILYVPHSLLYKNLQKYKGQYKVALLLKNNNNLDEFHDLHKVFDEKLNLDIISLHLREDKGIKNSLFSNKNDDNKTKNVKKLKKKLGLDDMIHRYTIKKTQIENNENVMNKNNSSIIDENLKYDLGVSGLSLELDGIIEDNNGSNFLDVPQNNEQIKILENNGIDEKAIKELDMLEEIFTHVPIPYFVEFTKDLRIEPEITKCYVTKNDADLLLKRIDKNFNIIVDNENDEILETYKNIINKSLSGKSFNVKLLMTNRKIMNILRLKTNQVEVFQYDIMRKSLYFKYYYIIANSVNGSIFAKTNFQHKKMDWQENDIFFKK